MDNRNKKGKVDLKESAVNEYCHIFYGKGSRKNKVYRTVDILLHINFSNIYKDICNECIIYDVNTKKAVEILSNVGINVMTISEYGNEYDLVGYAKGKRKKDALEKVLLFTDSDGDRNPDGNCLFSGFDVADAFGDNFKNYLCKQKG